MATISKTALYFKQVSEVIGEKKAEIELQKVIDSGCEFAADCDDDGIACAFIFDMSPQGCDFWIDITNKSSAWCDDSNDDDAW